MSVGSGRRDGDSQNAVGVAVPAGAVGAVARARVDDVKAEASADVDERAWRRRPASIAPAAVGHSTRTATATGHTVAAAEGSTPARSHTGVVRSTDKAAEARYTWVLTAGVEEQSTGEPAMVGRPQQGRRARPTPCAWPSQHSGAQRTKKMKTLIGRGCQRERGRREEGGGFRRSGVAKGAACNCEER